METKMAKGENVSDYFIRLKSAFSEADMEKASIETVIISLLIGNLLFQETPNTSEDDLYKFANKIKKVESLGFACDYPNTTTGRGSIRAVL